MAFKDLFSDQASLYALARPRYPAEIFEFISAQAPSQECAWDCGTGNGQAAVSLAKFFEKVYASDPSSEQIANALPASNVHYSVQSAESTDYPDGSFDAACVAQALHWFRFDEFFNEVRRVSRPGAVFAAIGYGWFTVQEDFDKLLSERVLRPIEPYWAPENRILWDEYKDVPFPFERISTPALGIEMQWNFFQLMAYLRTWSAVRLYQADIQRDILKDEEAELIRAWGNDPEDVRIVSMPVFTLAGRIA